MNAVAECAPERPATAALAECAPERPATAALAECAPERPATAALAEHAPERRASAGRKLVKGGLGVGAATTFASAANYLSNVVLGRVLGPAEFADAALVVSGLLLLGAVALGLQLTAARSVAAGVGPTAIRRIRRRAIEVGVGLGLLLIVLAPVVGRWFNMGSPMPIVILGSGVPVYLVMAVGRGIAQAGHRFGRLAMSIAAEAAARLAVTAALLLGGVGPTGASIALVVSFVAALVPCRPVLGEGPASASERAIEQSRTAVAATVLLLFGQVVISNGDLWVVAARLPDDSGVYAAVALIGRLVFIAAWSVITVVFPSLVSDRNAHPPAGLLGRAVVATAVVGGALTLGAALFSRPLMGTMVGDGFSDGAQLLWPYAFATTVFVLANLVAVADLAAGRVGGPAVVAVGGVVQTTVLFSGATSGTTWVVWAQVVLMVGLLAATLAVRTVRTVLARRSEIRLRLAPVGVVHPA